MANGCTTGSPFALKNIKLFLAFRILFNARFYYPVFTILFLDYGLTIEQFALLNTVWAITIVAAEVPSGALADILGRKKLIVTTSFLMIFELGVIAFVPLHNITLVFYAFMFNRVISGLAEAMASGADEALAYDTLANNNMRDCWPKVLSLQMRLKALVGLLTATTGALVYDPAVINRLLSLVGSTATVTQQDSMRYPVFLTLVLAFMATAVSLMFHDPAENYQKHNSHGSFSKNMTEALKITGKACVWILKTPFATAVILCGMFYDHVLRLLITMTSQYFRLIQLPEASFGLILATMSLLGLVVPKICEKMVERFTPTQNVFFLFGFSIVGLFLLSLFVPYFGVLPVAFVSIGLMMVSFFTSHYLNRVTSSDQRATVLSFKGLVFNLGYGLIGVFFAVLMQQTRARTGAHHPEWSEEMVEAQSFISAVGWTPWYTLALFVLLIFFLRHSLKNVSNHKRRG
ncbi:MULTISPECIES: MFS transporter [Desulfosediminicola]|uniref:MFS transporter n=1 Tax=Desulfosediminicola TaxID=2886823 RepID=UPI0010ACAB27|nr:MFS transporter [Desulfosediminicola ganghwensis]